MADDWKTWRGVADVRARCEAQAVCEGLAGLELFFRSQALFSDRLNAAPTYRERQDIWYAQQRAKNPPISNPLVAALEAIRDGHNDPRALASEALSTLHKKEA